MTEPTAAAKTPKHQWTHAGDRVLLVKCLDAAGQGRGGFQYPRSGPVACPAALTGEGGTIEVGPEALGAVTAKDWSWRVRKGAVVAWRWEGVSGLLRADELALADGAVVEVSAGVIRGANP